MMLTKSQKAVAILVAIGAPKAPELLKHFKRHEMKALLEIARGFRNVEPEVLDEIIREFEGDFAQGSGIVDSADIMNQMLIKSLGEEEFAELTDGKKRQPEQRKEDVWSILARADLDRIVAHVTGENEQAASHILSRLPESLTAQVLQKLDKARRASLVARMLTAKDVRPEAALLIEESVRQVFGGTASAGPVNEPGRLATVLNEMERDLLDDLLDDLQERVEPRQLASVTSRLFRFDDIVRLDQDARASVLDAMEATVLTDALRGAGEEIREAILSAIGQRSRRMIESDLASGAKGNPQVVADARRAIVATVLDKIDKGEITLGETGEMAA
ncbi:FliG C-terminal domain-containing protein [Zhengella sp. ZM62]|uniref:FliG C-terminal domain-containing protein n=1 Tax=Zhengella sedimenti TaxID=3390035 RepID=UPI003976A886